MAVPGGLAQLGERLHGMQEVMGSSPISSILKTLQDKDLRRQRIVPILYEMGCTNFCTKSVG
jgi:hypothetical protein